ncbi:MAG: glycosyltransferase family 4 protein [Verrucomicrobia bacterium]|nr:glycosyltransferase family 4 protein [Verrucomicrobiota bacterium]
MPPSAPASTADPRRLRLLFVVESGTDVRLVDGLAQRFTLRLLARTIGGGGREVSQAPAKPVDMERGPRSRWRFAALVIRRLWNWRAQERPDLVLTQGYGVAALACQLARRFLGGPPVVLLVCSPVEEYYRCRRDQPTVGGSRYRALEFFGLRALAKLNAWLGGDCVVLSAHLAGVVRSHGGSRRRSLHEIPLYGVDTTIFHPPAGDETKTARKAARGLPATGAVIFFSSRIAPEKDAETLLRAFAARIQAGDDLWLLHRSGGWREFLRAAETAGVAARVIATDAVFPGAELAADYRACDLVVQASRAEGLGFSVLEAFACAVPVVATAVGGLRETVRDGGTGWTYPPGDATALATALEAALSDPAEAARRAENGRRMVAEKYAAERVFADFAELAAKLAR